MKKLALLVILLVFCRSSFTAQNNPNTIFPTPNLTFIHASDLSNFSQAELNLLDGNYIVFEGELTETLVHNHLVVNKTNEAAPEQSLKPEEQQFVKEWLAAHPEVKIVSKSEYTASPENIRNEYVKSRCLILKGEIVRREDILNY